MLTRSSMDKQQDDFETLRDFNDYLEQVEEITWNLILKTDVEATESRLRRWEDHQKAELNPGATRRGQDVASDHAVQKKGVVQRKAPNASSGSAADHNKGKDTEDIGFNFRGLKKRVAPPKEAPFDPCSGWSISSQYYELQDNYDVGWYSQYTDTNNLAGGYVVRDFCNRTLLQAFSGLGVFVEDEISARELGGGFEKQQMAVAGKDVNMNDVF